MDSGRLILILVLLPTLLQFQFAGGRINGDGIMYYVYVRSLMKDFDLDFTNEYAHYGLLNRGDLSVPTKTGLRRSIFSIGPAVVWSPFFLLGEGVARAQGWCGQAVDLSGYGPAHRNAVALGSLLYGFTALLLIDSLLRQIFSRGIALGAVLLVWGGTFLHWYMVVQPTMSHAPSTFGATLAILLWSRNQKERTPVGFLILGLAMGLAMCIRWQNGVLLILPALEFIRKFREKGWKDISSLCFGGCLLGIGALVGAFPQMITWKTLYKMWILPYPPHGADFVRLHHPFVFETLFSSRHGLLSWTPIFWAGYLGFIPFLKRRPGLAIPLSIPLVLMTYVNFCSGDWWAGGSFSNRRFDSLLPILAFGLAASLEMAHRLIKKHPEAVLGLVVSVFVLWNITLAEQVRRNFVPRDDTVSFPRLVGNSARLVSHAIGSPMTWPASWLFAWRYDRPPDQFDLLYGRYLFYRQNNMGGHIAVGAPRDEAMLGEGWGPIETHQNLPGRRVRGPARFFAPLDVPEALEIRFHAVSEAPQAMKVFVNRQEIGSFWPQDTWGYHRLRVASSFWKSGLNEVSLDAGATEVWLGAINFLHLPGR